MLHIQTSRRKVLYVEYLVQHDFASLQISVVQLCSQCKDTQFERRGSKTGAGNSHKWTCSLFQFMAACSTKARTHGPKEARVQKHPLMRQRCMPARAGEAVLFGGWECWDPSKAACRQSQPCNTVHPVVLDK